jgi:hypothetical protein
MRKSVYKWHISFAETCCICAKKKNAVDVHVTRLWSVFMPRFSVVFRNPLDGHAGNWVMSLTLQCGLLYWYAELPRTGQFVLWPKLFSVMMLLFSVDL